ncbi:peter Pan-like protein [Selaginella moellendorffii]|uniref:peter Pan-like protein n=1 Tax=Selaginella moellendorffii TaxID=88036 RepID=UPI000D1C7DC0|nr:peter Pan-like protein [Selaginella moellendorffii]|eukprot:XP_024520802.1 peter Pan-like protein [Selaginella moellendorffii]
MGHTRRRKKHTHKELAPSHETGEKIPRSFVIGRGKLPVLLRNLEQDLRKLMLPHTALHLKESGKNTLKDFVHVAGPLGVSHFVILSNTKNAPYMKVVRSPHGPTMTFKVHDFCLAADVARALLRYRAPPSIFKNPPLVVLNGFNPAEAHLKLVTIMFQNIFPVIDVKKVKLSLCQRVLLLNYDKDTKVIDFRHYAISAQPVGVSRGIRKLVQRTKIPDLRTLNDVSEFVTKSGYGSESEAENESSRVTLPQDYGRGNPASQQSAVKLHEIGPRMTLQLVKVEEGLCSGAVMFHEYVKKTAEEVAELKETFEKREALRKQRKAEQEANVRRKELLREENKKKNKKKEEPVDDMDVDMDGEEQHEEEEEDDDADYYRQEVGEEPGEDFTTGAAQKRGFKRGFKVGRAKVNQFPKMGKFAMGKPRSNKREREREDHQRRGSKNKMGNPRSNKRGRGREDHQRSGSKNKRSKA